MDDSAYRRVDGSRYEPYDHLVRLNWWDLLFVPTLIAVVVIVAMEACGYRVPGWLIVGGMVPVLLWTVLNRLLWPGHRR